MCAGKADSYDHSRKGRDYFLLFDGIVEQTTIETMVTEGMLVLVQVVLVRI